MGTDDAEERECTQRPQRESNPRPSSCEVTALLPAPVIGAQSAHRCSLSSASSVPIPSVALAKGPFCVQLACSLLLPRVDSLTKTCSHSDLCAASPSQLRCLMGGKGTGWNNVFIPCAAVSPARVKRKQLGLFVHRRKHEFSLLLSPGWQRCRIQDYVRV